ncbi:ribonuclease H1 domain-containing protein [Peristeroidobacter agariperforans]|uniref:ribonuclease H1 domain-containing protein n=1 Tax=Peristeroidobacter agariperforans TaxID=268404 RepID=UPI00101C1B7E|nr:ribonuclease H family protein [Peristeroidobacter agariperforans]
MAQKFYVVWAGRQTGVFTDWATTHRQVDRFAGARYKSFATRAEAERAFAGGAPRSTFVRRAANKPSEQASVQAGPSPFDLQIYCDGACDPNPGRAGSGLAVYRNGELAQLWHGLYNPAGTNNIAELNALHRALEMAETAISSGLTVQILCDSTYAINCISKWAPGWEKKGWRKAGGEIKNLEIIQAAHAVYSRIESKVHLTHVSAHVGTEGNELADRMAMFAVESGNKELCEYGGKIDIPTILRMRAG